MAQHSRPDLESASSSHGGNSLDAIASLAQINADLSNAADTQTNRIPQTSIQSSFKKFSPLSNDVKLEENAINSQNLKFRQQEIGHDINVRSKPLLLSTNHNTNPNHKLQLDNNKITKNNTKLGKNIETKENQKPINSLSKNSTTGKKPHRAGSFEINGSHPQHQLSSKETKQLQNNNNKNSSNDSNNEIALKNIQEKSNINLEGRRTLIKNQLYLIEQLQLENASLRNERDQLQLENEELKFQLQMINSSNILSSDSTGNHDHHHDHLQRQHDRARPNDISIKQEQQRSSTRTTACFVEGVCQEQLRISASSLAAAAAAVSASTLETKPNLRNCDHRQSSVTRTTNTLLGSNYHTTALNKFTSNNSNKNQQQNKQANQLHAKGGPPLSGSQIMASSACGTSSSSSSLLHATPLRRPLSRSPGGNCESNTTTNHQLLFHNYDLHDQNQLLINCENFKRTRLYSGSLDNSNQASCLITTSKNDFGKQQLDAVAGRTTTASLADEDEENERVQIKLVEELFGDNRDQLRLAAVIIQRAFRRYQICKRFRTITEQLRQNIDAGTSRQASEQPAVNSRPVTTNESMIESLSQAAQQLIANTKAAVNSFAFATSEHQLQNQHQQQQQVNYNSPFKSLRKAFSSHQVNHLENNNSHPTSTTTTISTNSINSRGQILSIHHVEAHRALLYRVGLNIFNRTPEKGISYFIAHNFIENGLHVSNGPSFYLSDRINLSRSAANGHHPHSNITSSVIKNNFGSKKQRPSRMGLLFSDNCCNECLVEENIKRNVADFLASRRGLSREKIGLYLGNLQEKFNQDVLVHYLQAMDFCGLQVDVGLRKFLSGFRLPGEAQKIERLVEVFASRYVQSQAEHRHQLMAAQLEDDHLDSKSNYRLLSNIKEASAQDDSGHDKDSLKVPLLNKDEIFILSFAIIMLNTDLHSPSLKPQSRMSANQFVNNLRGLFKSQPVEEAELIGIYNRIKADQISTLPDHMVNLMHVQARLTVNNFQRKEMIPNLCQPHRRMVCYCRVYEVYDPQKKERFGQHQREIYLFNDMILICKIAKRIRTNLSEPPLAYRNSFPLQGLGVELFQSAHYDFGIRLYQLNNTNTTLMMFNSVNKQDQVRFTRDLQDSIAEIREMEEIKNKNIIDLLHLNFLEKLRKHFLMHEEQDEQQRQKLDQIDFVDGKQTKQLVGNSHMIINYGADPPLSSRSMTDLRETSLSLDENIHKQIGGRSNKTPVCNLTTPGNSIASLLDQPTSISSGSSSTSTSASATTNGSGPNINPEKPKSEFSHKAKPSINTNNVTKSSASVQRKCSASSVFSHDSGLFVMSRDVSPNQSS